MYRYNGVITKVIDGDTIVANIDLGLDTWLLNQKFRLSMINAPELTPKDPTHTVPYEAWCQLPGARSKMELIKKLGGLYMPDGKVIWPIDKLFLIATIKDRKEKYGRYLATVYAGEECINNWMIEQKLAVQYNG